MSEWQRPPDRWVDVTVDDDGVHVVGRVDGFNDVPLDADDPEMIASWLDLNTSQEARERVEYLSEQARALRTEDVRTATVSSRDHEVASPETTSTVDAPDAEADAQLSAAENVVAAAAPDALATASSDDDVAVSVARESVQSARFTNALNKLSAALLARRLADHGSVSVRSEVEHDATTMGYDARRDYAPVSQLDGLNRDGLER